ncbi:MAG: hypothetical protein LBD29_04355 [Treponema sp.]|jgi:hypothetical protein|nr:hypothetical protein [Treponema sp.]
MKRIIIILCLGLCGIVRGFAGPAQKVAYPGDWVYDALTALSLEQGRIFFTNSSLTYAQIELMLAEIDEASLSQSGLALYDQIYAYLNESSFLSFQSDIIDINVDTALQPELYFKTNETFDWEYKHGDRLRFFTLPADISVSSYLMLQSDLYIGENRRLSKVHDNYFNFPFDKHIDGVESFDTDFPKRAYLSAGLPLGKYSGINLRIGVGDNTYGRTKTGSIIISDTMKGINYAQLSLYSPWIKYTTEIMELEVNKYLYLHYFQMRLFNRLSLGIVEGVMVNAPFELRYLNPMMIFHGFTAWSDYGKYNEETGQEGLKSGDSRVGSYGGVILDWSPWKYFRIYGLFGMTEFQGPGEVGSDSTGPNAFAFQLGSETYIPVSSGHWRFGLEGVYTYPYMYILGHKNWSFYREANETSNPWSRDWVGNPFGPDSIVGTIWAGYQDTRLWAVSLSFLFAAQGENSETAVFDLPDNEYYANTPEENASVTPTGIPAYTYLINLNGKWSASSWLHFTLRTSYKIIYNFEHIQERLEQGFEISFSIQFTPKGLWSWKAPQPIR